MKCLGFSMKARNSQAGLVAYMNNSETKGISKLIEQA
jgi:hypothetical protein